MIPRWLRGLLAAGLGVGAAVRTDLLGTEVYQGVVLPLFAAACFLYLLVQIAPRGGSADFGGSAGDGCDFDGGGCDGGGDGGGGD